MTAPVDPWERQDGEPEAAYEAFKGYCFQTPPRRLKHSSVRHGHAELQKLYNEWRWGDRVLAWDRHVEKLRLQEREALLLQSEEERLAKWMSTLELVGGLIDREIAKLDRDSKNSEMSGTIRPSDLNKMLANYITLSRLIRGESTENVSISDPRLEKLSVDELRELQRIEAKMHGDEGEAKDPVH